MNIQYEEATSSDMENLYGFNKDLIDQYESIETIEYEKILLWVRRKIEAYIGGYKRILLNGELAGYYCFQPVGDKMELDDLYLFPAYQNQGIGTQVIRHCMDCSSSPIFLYVFSKNKGAFNLYKRLGFQQREIVGKNRYIMQWDNNKTK